MVNAAKPEREDKFPSTAPRSARSSASIFASPLLKSVLRKCCSETNVVPRIGDTTEGESIPTTASDFFEKMSYR